MSVYIWCINIVPLCKKAKTSNSRTFNSINIRRIDRSRKHSNAHIIVFNFHWWKLCHSATHKHKTHKLTNGTTYSYIIRTRTVLVIWEVLPPFQFVWHSWIFGIQTSTFWPWTRTWKSFRFFEIKFISLKTTKSYSRLQ